MEYRKTLSNYSLPEPCTHGREVEHELTQWNSDTSGLAAHANAACTAFNIEQRTIFDDVTDAVVNGKSLHVFIDGKAGTGKTHLVNVICDKIRLLARIVLPMAIAAFAAQH